MSPVAKGIMAAAIFVLVGPFAGGLIVGAITIIAAMSEVFSGVDGSGKDLASALNILPVIIMFAYILGGIPALLSGCWMAWQVAGERSVSAGAAGITGVIASLPLGLWLVSNDALNLMTAPKTLLTLGWYCFLGACAAVVCLSACRRFGLVLAPSPT